MIRYMLELLCFQGVEGRLQMDLVSMRNLLISVMFMIIEMWVLSHPAILHEIISLCRSSLDVQTWLLLGIFCQRLAPKDATHWLF